MRIFSQSILRVQSSRCWHSGFVVTSNHDTTLYKHMQQTSYYIHLPRARNLNDPKHAKRLANCCKLMKWATSPAHPRFWWYCLATLTFSSSISWRRISFIVAFMPAEKKVINNVASLFQAVLSLSSFARITQACIEGR